MLLVNAILPIPVEVYVASSEKSAAAITYLTLFTILGLIIKTCAVGLLPDSEFTTTVLVPLGAPSPPPQSYIAWWSKELFIK